MTVIKDLLSYRPDLKVVLMSATLNAEKFSEYFGEYNYNCYFRKLSQNHWIWGYLKKT